MSTPDFAAAARYYDTEGFRIIELHRVGPDGRTCSCGKGANCTSKGKHPKDNGWQKAPRLSGADIEALWGGDGPMPNVGIATGKDSGIWVLDIDPEAGGFETMRQLNAEHGPLPTTFVVKTGSGGFHYYFVAEDGLRNSAGKVGPGVDVRAEGGQVVAAPSKTDKGVYTIAGRNSLAVAPEWLLDLARHEQVDPSEIVTADDLPKPDDIDPATWTRLTAYAQRAIDSELGRLDACKAAATARAEDYRGEPWNHTTFEVSASLIEFANSPWCAYSIGQAFRDVREHAPRDSDFTDYDVDKTFASARTKVGPKARPMPEDRRQPDDAMFSGPHVQGPSGGDGTNAEPVARVRHYFGGEKGSTPIYPEMAGGVFDGGPVGWGVDSDFWSYNAGVWKPEHYVVKHRLIDCLGTAYKASHYQSTADIVQRHARPITGDPIEQLMNFGNGMLDWRTGDLSEHLPEYGSTVQLGCDWEADAECPRFTEFLREVMHEDYVALAWEMIGYLMMSGNPMQTAFLFYGSGGNGKGTLLNVMEMLLGPDNIASESLDDLNGNRFRSANLFGRIANLAGDIDATYQETTAMFKSITGEDMVTGERKNRDPFRFESWAVPVFSANKFPGSSDVTDGYLRRWIVLHFHKKITKVILRRELMEAFRRELPGIAARGVVALRELMERGHFDPQGEALKAKDEYAMSIDQVRRWFADGNAQVGPDVTTPLEKLYQNYQIWADKSGQKQLGQVEFSHRVENLGYEVTKLGGETYHKGISVPDVNHTTPTTAAWFEAN